MKFYGESPKELDKITNHSDNCDEEDLFMSNRNIYEVLEDSAIPLNKKKDYLDQQDIDSLIK